MNATLLKKLSVATVYGEISKDSEAVNNSSPIIRVFGIASGIRTGQSNFGDWVAFTGDFGAINLESGEAYRGPQVFIPQPAQGMLEAALSKSENVEFAFEIGVKPSKKGSMGYEYTVRPIKEASDSDAFAALADLSRTDLPQLGHDGDTPKAKKGKK